MRPISANEIDDRTARDFTAGFIFAYVVGIILTAFFATIVVVVEMSKHSAGYMILGMLAPTAVAAGVIIVIWFRAEKVKFCVRLLSRGGMLMDKKMLSSRASK